MVDISQDIEWEQNFEFDEKLQSKANDTNDADTNHSLSSNAATTTSDDEQEPFDNDVDINDGSKRHRRKRTRRPSNAELIDRVKKQQQHDIDELHEDHSPPNNDNTPNNDEQTMHVYVQTNPAITTTNNTAHLADEQKSKADANSESAEHEHKEQQVLKKTDIQNFYDAEKHVFIVTWGGRPLYTRHGSLNDRHMTSFMGVVSLFPANVERVNILTQDDIRSFVTYDGVKFVYLIAGPLYFFCITRTTETIEQIRNSMRYYHSLIVMTLTNVFERTLNQSPQFDMRSIFGPTDYMLLENLVNDADISPTYLFNSYYPLEINKNQRDEIGNIIKQCKKNANYDDNGSSNQWTKKLLYSLLFMNGAIISYTQPKKRPLHHEDVILLSHFVKNSQSWKQSEAFTPICLPHFEPSGFVYCYVSYFGEISNESEAVDGKQICMIILTLDATSFKRCQLLRKSIEHSLFQSSLIQSIKQSYFNQYPLKTAFIVNKILKILTPEIYCFYYNNIKKKQYIYPQPIKLYNTPIGNKTLFRRLQHLHNRIHSTPVHEVYFERCSTDSAICKLQPNQFEVYIIMNSFVSKKDAQNVLNKLVNWINIHSNNLFMNGVNW